MADTSTPTTSSDDTYSFEGFLHGWYAYQDQLLTEITEAVSDDKVGDDEEVAATEIVSRALVHFEEYYLQKSRAAQHNVFSLFSPSWCCSLECAFMWITGFRPTILLQLVSHSVNNLTTSQLQAIHRLQKETRKEEKEIGDELAKIQEKAAAPPIIDGLKNPTISSTRNEALGQLQTALEEVVANADTLRVTTAANVAAILVPSQGLRFLAAAFRLQQGMRMLQFKTNNCASTEDGCF